MKTAALLLVGAVFVVHLPAQTLDLEVTAPPPLKVPATTHVMGERGASHRVWQRVTGVTNRLGTVEWSTNTAYVELASGLHYQDGRGVWQETKEEFELVPGWAVARKGPHKVSIAQNLNARGSVALEQPDGRMLRSQVVGLSYFDHGSGQSVLIAEIKDCAGTVLPPNQVIYEDAFTGVKADVRYTYTRAGLEQDIILRAQPPAPETFGLRSATTRLVVITEFFDTPTPGARAVDAGDPDEDVDLDFGSMRMGRGKAFELNATGTRGEREVPVRKEWRRQDGRDFLLEEVPVSAVRAELEKLPRQAAVRSKATPVALARMEVPAPRDSRASDKPLQMAAAKMPAPGFVLDYVIVAENTGSFTFQADTTYYINGMLYLDGTTTIEGGTVIKYERSSALYCTGPVVCKTAPYQPAVLTAVDDDTVGEMISTSTHVPTDYYAYVALQCNQTTDLSYLCVRYADYGLISGGSLRHSQFINNYKDVYLGGGSLEIGNVLFQNSGWYAMGMYGSTVSAVNVTVHNVNRLWESLGGSSTLRLTNSLLIRLTNQCAAFTSFNTYSNGTDAGVFQTVGAGAHYLAPGSANRNVATTNINPTLLADLRKKTTYAPSVITNYTIYYNTTIGVVAARDTDPLDRGYHYDPVDYLVNACSMSNARLTVTNGAVVASYLDTAGLWLQGGGSIVAVGTPQVPVRFTYYNTAQEQPVFLSTQARSNFVYACMIDPYRTGGAAATGTFRFAQFTGLAGAGIPFRDQGANREFGSLSFHSCEFGPVYGSLTVWPTTSSPREFVNNLFWRTDFSLTPEGGAMCVLSNNLFWWSNPLLLRPLTGGTARVYNNAFERCVLNTGAPAITGILSNNYNGYLACGGTVPLAGSGSSNVTAALTAYQAGPLGRFYQPTNSALINKGSTLAGQAGLYHYTTATNQVKEAGTRVDIGYHYVAVNPATGTLPDTDSDGLPDYLDSDSDGDGLPDTWELQIFGSLNENASGDGDFDDLTNFQELQLGTSPVNWDTDGDGLSDAEELTILIDANHPEWGYLNPLKAISGRKKNSDGNLDADHDGLTNLGELRDYLTDPMNAHSYSAGLNDAEYFHMAYLNISGQPPLPPAYQALARGLQINLGGGQLQFTITEAFANHRYDLYFVNNLISSRWQWRRVYSDIICDANGEATITLQQPDPWTGFFIILSAEDRDFDGLTDGYETWFSYNGEKTSPDVDDSDLDLMTDDWEVEYGLNPTSTGGPADGAAGNPDGDAYPNKDEHDSYKNYGYYNPSYDPLKVYNTTANRPVVVIANSTQDSSCPVSSFTITRAVGDGGNYGNPLTVYYSVGGTLRYGTDYILSPAPSEYPRIFSAVIPANEQSVIVTATLIGNPVTTGSKSLTATITPYSVSPVTQIADPLAWSYAVDWHNNRTEITFNSNNLRPYADDQSLTVCPNADTAIVLSGYDGCNDPLTFVVLSGPTHGTLSGTAPNLTYHPDLDYLGSDSFTFKVNVGAFDSLPATVDIYVDNQPVAKSQGPITTCRNEDLLIVLMGQGGCDQPLTFTVLTSPTHGTLSGTLPNLTYHPAQDYEGEDSFTFKVSNGLQESTEATVYIEVGYAAVANTDSRVITDVSRPFSITLVATDRCNDPLTYSIVTQPTLGSLSGTPPTLTYAPTTAGQDYFTFKANDGVRDSNEGYVYVDVLSGATVTATCGPLSVLIEWSVEPWAQNNIDDFLIYRSTTPGGSYPGGQLVATLPGYVLSYRDAVTSGVTYYYTVVFHYTDLGASTSHPVASDEISSSTCCPSEFWTGSEVTAQQLAEWVSAPGDNVANTTFTGATVARGIFGQGSTAGLPIDNGVILSSGDIALAKGPNDKGNAGIDNDSDGYIDFQQIVPGINTHNAAILEFDVMSASTEISYQFIFASEEYHEFIGNFNDLCAIWVDDVNIALVPGTTDPVAVNTVQDGYPPHNIDPVNEECFVNNEYPPPINFQFNGLTTLLTVQASITPNVTHHVKIAIADANDEFLDSAIMIKAVRPLPCP